jgi:hypothetical protein
MVQLTNHTFKTPNKHLINRNVKSNIFEHLKKTKEIIFDNFLVFIKVYLFVFWFFYLCFGIMYEINLSFTKSLIMIILKILFLT